MTDFLWYNQRDKIHPERDTNTMIKVLFICHGNICRSPMAEFVMKDLVDKAGLAGGGDRQPGLSPGPAQTGRAWDLLRR